MSHWNNPGDIDRRWATELHNAFQGSARVNLSLIEIGPEWQLNNENVDALSRVFEKKGVYPLQRENHVEVKVSRANLERALRESGVTADELRQSEPASFPELKFAGVQLDCLHGKHRVQAARRMLPPFRWWIVDIYLDSQLSRKISTNEYMDSQMLQIFRMSYEGPKQKNTSMKSQSQ